MTDINKTFRFDDDDAESPDYMYTSMLAKERGIARNMTIYGASSMPTVDRIEMVENLSTHFEYYDTRINLDPISLFELLKEITGRAFKFNFFQDSIFLSCADLILTVYYDTFGRGFNLSAKYRVYSYSPDRELLLHIKKELLDRTAALKVNSVVWALQAPNKQILYKEMQLQNDSTEAHDSFYPWLHRGLDDYYKSFIQSEENVLLLTGMPGTGKTTFIKNLLARNSLNAVITYDEQLLKDDQFFLDFLSDDKDIMVIEDSDTMIYDREKDDNNLLSKILNVSDGLIKNISKKIIFSTNITDIDRIDPALMRPGRCYDVLDFRRLTSVEAQKVLDDLSITKELSETREYTLAELVTKGNRKQQEKFRMGIR